MKLLKFVSFFLSMILLSSMLTACPPEDAYGEDSTTGGEKMSQDIVIVENRESDFIVMRSDVAEQYEIDAAVDFRKNLNAACESNVSITTDWVKRGEEVPTDTKELLIGSTNRAETADAMSRIGEGQYIIKAYEHRIVLYSDSKDGMDQAVAIFAEQFLQDCGGTLRIPADFELIADTPKVDYSGILVGQPDPDDEPEPERTRVSFYVATDGSDANDGKSPEKPFATLEKARDAARALGAEYVATVYLRGGVYRLSKTFSLTASDSGTRDVPTIYTSYPGERALLSGGVTLDKESFAAVTDEAILTRLDETVRDKVIVCDLPPELSKALGQYGESLSPAELFLDDQPLQICRWPNEGFVTVLKAIDTNKITFSVSTPLPTWLQTSHMRVNGYWGNDWYMNDLGIASVDYAANTITTTGKPSYTLKAGQRFYAFNILEELDAPGEWYIDRENSKLYLYPPESFAEKTLTVSATSSTLLSITGAKNIKITNLDFAYGRENAISISGEGKNNLIYNCTISNMGGRAVSVQGTRCGVADSHIYNTGRGGITLESGEVATLKGAANFAVNNEMHNYSRIIRTYCPAVDIKGVGNYVLFNEIYDAPHFAIRFTGQCHQIRYNYIHNVVQETADASAVYAGRSMVWRGNDVSFNYFKDILTPDLRVSTAAIYLDDYMSGVMIEGNIFENIGKEAVKLANGRDNTVRNNIIIKASTFIGHRTRNYKVGEKNYNSLMSRFESAPYQSPLWLAAFPELEKMIVNEKTMEHLRPINNTVENNVCIGSGGISGGSDEKQLGVYRNNPSLPAGTDIGFVNMAEGNYALKSDASIYTTLPGFVEPPFAWMGMLDEDVEAILADSIVYVRGETHAFVNGAWQALSTVAEVHYAPETVKTEGQTVYELANDLVIVRAGDLTLDESTQYGQELAAALVRKCRFGY